MEEKILTCKFSIFGDFRQAIQEISTISSFFDDEYKRDNVPINQMRQFQNGQIAPVYVPLYSFSSKQILISIIDNRIDFDFSNLDEAPINIISEKINLFAKYLDSINRIAINYSYFIEDNNKQYLKEFSKSLSLFKKTECLQELFIRQNKISIIDDVKFNNLVTIQYGTIVDKLTFSNMNGIILSLDFNSVINQAVYFSSDRLISWFEKLKIEVLDQAKYLKEQFLNDK